VDSLQKEKVFFLLFPTIHDVLKTEKRLKAENIGYELVPVPRNLSSDCGVCIKTKDITIIAKLGDIKVESCYEFDGRDFNEFTIR